jgi:hypothetical protein
MFDAIEGVKKRVQEFRELACSWTLTFALVMYVRRVREDKAR